MTHGLALADGIAIYDFVIRYSLISLKHKEVAIDV